MKKNSHIIISVAIGIVIGAAGIALYYNSNKKETPNPVKTVDKHREWFDSAKWLFKLNMDSVRQWKVEVVESRKRIAQNHQKNKYENSQIDRFNRSTRIRWNDSTLRANGLK